MNTLRRRLLHRGVQAVGLASVGAPAWALAAPMATPRALQMVHTHTQERIDIAFADSAGFVPQALAALNHFLRDHYSGDIGTIDPGLFELLHRVRARLGTDLPFAVISGYRSPLTNDRLRRTRGGGVARRSLHMDGQAIDVRLPGVPLTELRDAALEFAAGGVGFYARENFVHVDTGRVRRW